MGGSAFETVPVMSSMGPVWLGALNAASPITPIARDKSHPQHIHFRALRDSGIISHPAEARLIGFAAGCESLFERGDTQRRHRAFLDPGQSLALPARLTIQIFVFDYSSQGTMSEQSTLTRPNLKTPRAAAIAGVLFSVLLLAALWLLRISVPDDPREPGAWLNSASSTVALAINLVPFAGIAFLWFIGVLRDRLGASEETNSLQRFSSAAACCFLECYLRLLLSPVR
jgi:hypothetical protein